MDEEFAFLNLGEAADFLRVSRTYLSRLGRQGGGPPRLRFGRAVRFMRTDLVTWAQAQRTAARTGSAA